MAAECTYDYAIIRVVPRVERGESINAGIIMSCPELNFLDACVSLNEARLRSLDPQADVELVRRHLETFPAVCRGGVTTEPSDATSRSRARSVHRARRRACPPQRAARGPHAAAHRR